MARRQEHQFNVRLSEDEKQLLDKGAKAGGLSVADYLRTCFIMDRLIALDPLAVKLASHAVRDAFQARVRDLVSKGTLHL